MSKAAIWSSGFRPFFLAAASYGPLLLCLWFGARSGWWMVPDGGLGLPMLHAHELLFGFAAALVCGVLTTALPSWTGATELRGRPLVVLAALWFAGRLAMYVAGWLPQLLVAVLDCALLPALCVMLLLTIGASRRRLFWWTLPPLAGFAAANIVFHVAILRGNSGGAQWALMLGVDMLAFLFVLYAGLFVPAFTRRWLRARGEKSAAILMPLEYATAAVMVVFAGADLFGAPRAWMAAVALAAAAIHAWRFARWRGWRVLGEPLLWCVHLGYLWLIVAFLLRAGAALFSGVPRDAWIHAFTIGAYSTLKIGLMTRVALRHTGRPLKASVAVQVAFIMMSAAALLRLIFALHGLDQRALDAAALLWASAFVIYLVIHGPMLLRSSLPRPSTQSLRALSFGAE
ncbi:MAG: NnrS family protein [Alphaproteobacteria bacterium]|nr:NnrS family protein [Alphaproteobacteria bacterium]MDE2074171.1 NnrS family protein [Alphaproteobacteria bacterium]MDE2353093.1 NnrS family protein [Alphaproteobacteria bacterium]